MSLPKSVYELLELLSSVGGRMPDAKIPGHLRNALHICQRQPPRIVRVSVAGQLVAPTVEPTIWKLTPEGQGDLAFYHETEAERTTAEAEGATQPPLPKEPFSRRLTVDLDGMSATPPGVTPAGMPWRTAAERMEQLRSKGEPFTSQQMLAKQLGCSSATINKAISNTPSLRNWAERNAAAPRAQSLSDVVTDRTAQSSVPRPEDDAAIREYLERDLDPAERAFFNDLSRENQLFFLNDPDKHPKILGRKG